jgi:hypothetical protein
VPSRRIRWFALYAIAVAAALIAGFNDHGLIPGLPTSIIGSILNQLVKTVGLLGVGDMVLYFREREAHDRTKQELAELRAAQQKAQEQRAEAQQTLMQQQAEDRRLFLEQMRLLQEEIRLLRAQSHHHNGTDDDDVTPTN